MKNLSSSFNNDLNVLESKVANYFSELLHKKNEIIIFALEDLEHETPLDYLEMRNDITGNVFDVHPIKVTDEGILVIEAEDTSKKHLIALHSLSSIQDRITLCELMEDNLD